MREIVPYLFQGNLLDGIVASDMEIVVTCSLESEVTALRTRPLRILFAFADAAVLPDMDLAESIVGLVAHAVALRRRTLIHCTAGKNRSEFITALVLRRLGIGQDLARHGQGSALVDFIRAGNPDAFTAPGPGGPFFADYLRTT